MTKTTKQKNSDSNETLEQKLWKSADKLRKNIDAAEYKHIVLGLIFLKYISDSFEELHQKLIAGEGDYAGANPEDKDEYVAENVFFVPENARWNYLQNHAKGPNIGKLVDDAMDLIEAENPRLKGILPKVFARQNLDKSSLGDLIDLIGKGKLVNENKQIDIDLEAAEKQLQQPDILGRVYEYFLGQFALNEGKKGGQFYTPESIVKLLVEMLEPYNGRIFDPCCGSGGMFVQSEKFIKNHERKIDNISLFGQESNETTYKLCRMNLAIRKIDSSNIKWNAEGSLLKDAHPDLKADFIIANPPFNDSDWSGNLLKKDGRWRFGVPPEGNANFAWVQHFIYHLSSTGKAGFVLSNGSLSSNTGGEGEIRQKIIESDLVDCIIMLPTQLFYNTGIPACLWFLNKSKNSRSGEVLFIDVSEMGEMINRRNRILNDDEIYKIAATYHQWKKGNYQDIKGFCKSASLEEIKKHNFVLTPGRYVGIADEEDQGINFYAIMDELTQELGEQMRESRLLDEEIKLQLGNIGFLIGDY